MRMYADEQIEIDWRNLVWLRTCMNKI